ncbi:hypothetical protein KP77_28640 [Jeotgalibacillus alimentarius]|uniref:Mg chelatase-related protein C-terminal domain-containing protein n=1 Tax=Jeotgalibacillus alimentarius TaxID=135826 RepID=A0A0C2V9F2_9BACL|nr:hypothetical protein [Jeotgalibacillus alimentarius]KIL45572.1 hypothetical protein KP77_28640 [Jeotgalibacillus alimentarius]
MCSGQGAVIKARKIQRERYGANYTNGIVPIKLFEETTSFTIKQRKRVQDVSFAEKLSSRSAMKILRLAQTISDLNGEVEMSDQSVEEALQWKIKAAEVHQSLMR